MPFWLHESRVVHRARELSSRVLVFVALSCILGAAGARLVYKQSNSFYVSMDTKLQKVLEELPGVHKKNIQPVVQVPLDIRTVPQTVHFFTLHDFRVERIDRMVQSRNQRVAGYKICVQGSFETLIKFLIALKPMPAFRLHVQAIERINNDKLAVEFFMSGASV